LQEILGVGVAIEIEDPDSEFGGLFPGVIGGTGVHQDDFIGVFRYRTQARFDCLGVVARDQADR
jgi:hypothetical protein